MRAAAALLLASMAAGAAGLAASAPPSAGGGGGATAAKRFAAVLWDVDGTLAATTALGFSATNAVLAARGHRTIAEAEYKQGCVYTTPRRFGWHASGGPDGGDPDDPRGQELGDLFDEMCARARGGGGGGGSRPRARALASVSRPRAHALGRRARTPFARSLALLARARALYKKRYVELVSMETAPFYDGIRPLCDELAAAGKLGALSNACGACASRRRRRPRPRFLARVFRPPL